ncbi:MAG: hypothetical protein JEY99_08120 [Spirochaetales bacterium]|nr:hypothetical protein [Spirochaetales bacterium]
MRKYFSGLIILVLSIFIMTGCEDLFTTSAFEALAKDPSDMTSAQLETHAATVLSSGDSAAMAEVLTALADDLAATTAAEDPGLYLLATDLALGGSGLTDAIVEVVPDVLAGDINMDESYYTDLLATFDQDLISDSVTTFEAVALAAAGDDSIEITESQYTNAAVAQALVLLDESSGSTDIFTSPTAEQEADVQNVLDWAEAGGVDLSTLIPGVDFEGLEL